MMDFSQITETLFIGTTPRQETYDLLRDLGVRLVINMRIERPPHQDDHKMPLSILWIPTFDAPIFPIPLHALRKGVNAALATFAQGGKVYAHCAQGIHRGVALGSAILIAQGYSAEEAMQLIKERRKAADPDAWYIKRQIVRFAETWNRWNQKLASL